MATHYTLYRPTLILDFFIIYIGYIYLFVIIISIILIITDDHHYKSVLRLFWEHQPYTLYRLIWQV